MATDRIGEQQLEHYWQQGYTVVPSLFEREDLERWSRRLEDIVEGRVAPAQRMLVMREVMVAKGVEQVIGPDIQTIHCMLINKPFWDEGEEAQSQRWFRPIRGRAPDYGEVPKGAERPGRPAFEMPRSTRRA